MSPIEAQLPLLRALRPGPLACRWNLHRPATTPAKAPRRNTPRSATCKTPTLPPAPTSPASYRHLRRRAKCLCDHQ
ncbi:hypothetical protein CK620_04580 [Vandammella animalimorsus]|uniref:Uncharacterized protein n=1 Tax=Vandammella animalimorsus TaxID=2029117 RepID=A0A2A2A9I2_9BURK|nr:hypothetical protein CK620_04580 [Vandammella animalimorsus]